MRILIFEWLTSGGLWVDNVNPSGSSMERQGSQMLAAVAKDFRSGGCQVVLPLDCRLTNTFPDEAGVEIHPVDGNVELSEAIQAIAASADHVLVIAPETDSILLKCLQWFENDLFCKLINPNVAFTKLTSNKNLTSEYLKKKRFSKFPRGGSFESYLEATGNFEVWPLPLVFKPADGAGGDGVHVINDWSGWNPEIDRPYSDYRIESFVSGISVSVSAIRGPARWNLLAPTEQLFAKGKPTGAGQLRGACHSSVGDHQNAMHYEGAGFPIDQKISNRALELASEVVAILPSTVGYFGMDMVIGEKEEWLIEINPRLTSSYLKLREIYSQNLAMLMLDGARSNQEFTSECTVPSRCTFLKPSP